MISSKEKLNLCWNHPPINNYPGSIILPGSAMIDLATMVDGPRVAVLCVDIGELHQDGQPGVADITCDWSLG